MSKDRLALLVAGTLILVSIAWITYLRTERADATRQTAVSRDAAIDEEIRAQATASGPSAQAAPRSFAEQVSSSQQPRQAGLIKAATSALIGGAFDAGPGTVVKTEAR